MSISSLRHMVCGTISAALSEVFKGIKAKKYCEIDLAAMQCVNEETKFLPLKKSVAGHLETAVAAQQAHRSCLEIESPKQIAQW